MSNINILYHHKRLRLKMGYRRESVKRYASVQLDEKRRLLEGKGE